MKTDRLDNWLQRALDTREDEISCTECFQEVSAYVELDLAGGAARLQMPQVAHHLAQCPACRDEFEALLDLRRQEESGGLPTIDDLRSSL